MFVYLETSAFLSLLLREKSAATVAEILESAQVICSSILITLEASRAMRRLESERELTPKEINVYLADIAGFAASWHLLEITKTVQERAKEKFPVEPIKSLDAIHLASALELAKLFPDLQVLSCDKRVLDNLPGLGLKSAT